ncbi:MAG: hypothetical protein OWQ54_04360 [Sulfolobaceae archaeon]|nr:hypothetical protein [Sulfolobaceae archaeon]
MVKLIVRYKIQGRTYSLRLEGEEPKIYEDLDKVLHTLCEKFNNIEEYSVSELVSITPLGKIIGTVASNLLIHSTDYKISDDEITDIIAKTVLGSAIGLTIGHIVDSVIEIEREKFSVKSPCLPIRENPLASVITEWK